MKLGLALGMLVSVLTDGRLSGSKTGCGSSRSRLLSISMSCCTTPIQSSLRMLPMVTFRFASGKSGETDLPSRALSRCRVSSCSQLANRHLMLAIFDSLDASRLHFLQRFSRSANLYNGTIRHGHCRRFFHLDMDQPILFTSWG